MKKIALILLLVLVIALFFGCTQNEQSQNQLGPVGKQTTTPPGIDRNKIINSPEPIDPTKPVPPINPVDNPVPVETIENDYNVPLYFVPMMHLESNLVVDNNIVYERVGGQIKEILDLFDKYDAKITLESELPYSTASALYGDGMLKYALSIGMGVGTHCDILPTSMASSTEFYNRKIAVDEIVGESNNLGCSGGWSKGNWAQAAYDGGFSYLDGVVMYAYMGVPEKNRPISPETGKPLTDLEIKNTYYHDAAIVDFEDRMYPRIVKDTNDLNGDSNGIIVLLTGELGEISSLFEDRKNCFPDCVLTADDTNYILNTINYANSIRDRSKFAELSIHVPTSTIGSDKNGKITNIAILENWLKEMQEYQKQGKIKWATMKEAYGEYVRHNNISVTLPRKTPSAIGDTNTSAPLSTDKCGDGVCDTIESSRGICPKDCLS